MGIEVGGWLSWRETEYQLVSIRERSAVLRDADGAEAEVAIDELDRTARPAMGVTSRLIRASHAVALPEDRADPWVRAIMRIEAAEAGQRGSAIAAEAERLSDLLGKNVSYRTLQRRAKDARDLGLFAVTRGSKPKTRKRRTSSLDPRIVEALTYEIDHRARSSTVSGATLIDKALCRVRRLHGSEVRIPSRATLYRILKEETNGLFTFGSAKTRESLDLRPDRTFGSRTALRPGELVEMDSTRLDVMMRFDETTIGRPELTILIDVATRSILATLLRPVGTKSVDLVVVLARALVPYARRLEGARETRRLISTAWAEDELIDQETLDRLRLAQPFIFPETITTDRGRNFISRHFREACDALGISLITAAPHTPTDKPHVERTIQSINSLLLQHTVGYVGRSVEHRGRNIDAQSDRLLTVAQGQELLEDWIAAEWQNRSHDGLRDPLQPSVKLSPNEMCRAFRVYVPELHVPLTREDYIALLPLHFRRINQYGIRIDNRIYNSKRLEGLSRRDSGDRDKNGRWAVRVDPYNLHVIWLELDEEFIPLRWMNEVHDLPLLGDVWRYARALKEQERDQGDADRAAVVAAIRRFTSSGNSPTRAGNIKASARKQAQIETVQQDPMNLTGLIDQLEQGQPDAPTLPVEVDGDVGIAVDVFDVWPNRGGFPFIGDSLDEVKKRVEE